jgi:hypothetical protein
VYTLTEEDIMAVPIQKLLSRIIEKDDWRLDLARRWDSVVGSLQTKIRLEKTYDDTAVIGVYESYWMQELYLLSAELCDSINDVIGQKKIKQIRFQLVEARERPQAKPLPKAYVRPKVVPLTQSQKMALTKIQDPLLKEAMTEFWMRCAARAAL